MLSALLLPKYRDYSAAVNAVMSHLDASDFLMVISLIDQPIKEKLLPSTIRRMMTGLNVDLWAQACTVQRAAEDRGLIAKSTDFTWLNGWQTDLASVRLDLLLHSCTWWPEKEARRKKLVPIGNGPGFEYVDAPSETQTLRLAPRLKSCHLHFIPSFSPLASPSSSSSSSSSSTRRTVGKNEVVDVDFHPKLQVIALIVRTHKTNSFCDTLVVYAFGELQRQWNSRMLLQHPFDERFGLYSSTCVLVKWSPRGSYLLTRESGCLVDNKLARLRFYKFDACLGRVLKIVGSGMTVHSYSATKNLWLNERDVILPSPSGTTDLPRLLSLSDDGLSMSIIEPKSPDDPDPIEFPLLFLTAVGSSLFGYVTNCSQEEGPLGLLCPHDHQRVHIRSVESLLDIWLIDLPGFVLSMQSSRGRLCVLYYRARRRAFSKNQDSLPVVSKPDGNGKRNETVEKNEALNDFVKTSFSRNNHAPFLWDYSVPNHREYLDDLNFLAEKNRKSCNLELLGPEWPEKSIEFEYFEFDYSQGIIDYHRVLPERLSRPLALIEREQIGSWPPYAPVWKCEYARSTGLASVLNGMHLMNVTKLFTFFYTFDLRKEDSVPGGTRALHRHHHTRGLYKLTGSGHFFFDCQNAIYLDCRIWAGTNYGYEIRSFDFGTISAARGKHLFGRWPVAEPTNVDYDSLVVNDRSDGFAKYRYKKTEIPAGNNSKTIVENEIWCQRHINYLQERDLFDECDTTHELHHAALVEAYHPTKNWIDTRKRTYYSSSS